MLKKYLIGGVMLVILVGGGAFIFSQANSNTVAAQEASQRQTAVVQRTTLNTTIESTGTIEANRVLYLTFDTNGQVQDILVSEGDTVTEGQTLAQLDTADLEYQLQLQALSLKAQQANYDKTMADPTEQEVAQANSSVLSAQSSLLNAENSLGNAENQILINCANVQTRLNDLTDAQEAYDDYVADGYASDANFVPDMDSAQGQALTSAQSNYDVAQAQCDNTTPVSIYQAQLDSAKANVVQAEANLANLQDGATQAEIDSATAQLDQAKLQYQDAEDNLNNAVLNAPITGTVAEVNVVEGQSVTSATQAITLVDATQHHIDVSVDEMDVPQLKVGQKVTISPEALEGVVLEGEVVSVSTLGTNTSGIVYYTVRVSLSDVNTESLRIGMTADVSFVLTSAENVLAVPTDAIQRQGTNEFVEIVNADGTTTFVPVTTGVTADDLTEITGDISEGTQVVVTDRTATSTTTGFGAPGGGGLMMPFGGN